jgi:hypothetical protein
MKNIHISPTENSSRLSHNKDGVLELHRLQWRKGTQNMYITSDEEIKKEDWVYNLKYSNVRKIFLSVNGINSIQKEDRKIILTTDQDLIKDGVWGIEDGFLEWFVKNPDCEFVELRGYSIILPGEWEEDTSEPKQDKKTYSEEEVRKISLDFFYHWWNAKGSNTEQGFDKWFEQVKKK